MRESAGRNQRERARAALRLALVPAGFVIVAGLFPARQYHWDTLERAYLLEHPARYLRTWDGSPRSQFLSFAHVLELPLAALVRGVVPGHAGLQALVVFEAFAAAAVLAFAGILVRFWRREGPRPCGGLRDAMLAQCLIAVSFAFWKMGTSGEEKILALASQLLFLWVFWRGLARGGAAWGVAAALAFAILAHTTGLVLAPCAILALLALPAAWRPRRARVARGVVAGAVTGVLALWAVAAWTTHVRGPREFVDYLTFFHRAAGNNFFEPSGAQPATHTDRIARCLTGLGSFFTATPWAAHVALAILAAGALAPAFVRGRHAAETTLRMHAVLLAALWSLHFAFFEPDHYESWTLPAALLVLAGVVALPRGRAAWVAWALPVFLVVVDVPHLTATHREMPLAAYRRVVERRTQPGDIVVLVGGMQNGKPLRGSISMRYFLATERRRTLASLYDILGVTQPEYWSRPFTSPAALQQALDAGQRAYVPGFLQPDLERANASGLVHIEWRAPRDSLLEIIRIAGTR